MYIIIISFSFNSTYTNENLRMDVYFLPLMEEINTKIKTIFV